MTKRLLDNSAEVSLEQAAFLQKRAPTFEGR